MKKHHGIALLALYLSVVSVCMGQPGQWDSSRYIHVDEICKDMPAYCLTVLEGEKVEKFGLKVLSVVRKASADKDLILVIGTDERFQKIGSVHGCSGSPVFIDGRMAGALSAGWDGSLEPLYLVTPIEYMLDIDVNAGKNVASPLSSMSCVDVSAPLNLKEIGHKALAMYEKSSVSDRQLPLVTNLSAGACRALDGTFERMGLMPVQAGDMLGVSSNREIVPGGVLAVPVCAGDIQMSVVGTATEVVGNTVYGFGHPFLGTGATELPITAGVVHTVIATRETSFKLASPGPVIGTLRRDQAMGIVGEIGPIPKRIDLEIKVKRFDTSQEQTFHCQIVKDRQLTPQVLRAALIESILNQGDLPPEHHIRYQCEMTLENGYVFNFGGLSSGQSIQEPVMNTFALTALLLNNPFQEMPLKKVTLSIDMQPQSLLASVWEARISNTVVKPGQTAQVTVVVKTFRGDFREFTVDIPIPADCPQGKYVLQFGGADAYQDFLTTTAPQRFTATDAKSLLAGLTKVLSIPSDRLYVCMPMAPSGISIRDTELADLPASRTALLTEGKRMLPTTPYRDYIEASVETGLMLTGSANVELTVNKNP